MVLRCFMFISLPQATLTILVATAAAPLSTPPFRVGLMVTAQSDVETALNSHLSDLKGVRALVVRGVDTKTSLTAELSGAQRAARAQDLNVVVWCNEKTPDVLWLWVSDTEGERLLQRKVEGGLSSSREGKLEQLALLLRSTVRALLPRDAPKPEKAARLPAPPAKIPGGPYFHVGYGLAPLNASHLLAHELLLGVGVAFGTWRAGAGYRRRFATRFEGPAGRFQLGAHTGQLTMYRPWLTSAATAIGARLGVQAQLAAWRFSANDSPSRAGTAWLFGAQAGVSLVLRAGKRLTVSAVLGADFWANESRYGLQHNGSRTTVARPWPVRPWIRLELSLASG